MPDLAVAALGALALFVAMVVAGYFLPPIEPERRYAVYIMGDTVVMHPDAWDAIREDFETVNTSLGELTAAMAGFKVVLNEFVEVYENE